MSACWRALAARPELDVSVLAFRTDQENAAPFAENVMGGIQSRLLSSDERGNAALVASLVAEQAPDAIVVSGWAHPSYVRLAFESKLNAVKWVMAMDTPLKNSWRQRLARWKIGSYLKRMDRVVVAGERSWQLARMLGIPESQILRGVYGYDDKLCAGLLEKRRAQPGGWPKRFLFVGRYVDAKGIDVLVEAYRRYRSMVQDPWPLSCCGDGPLKETLRREGGITDLGFVQPAGQPDVWASHGAFVFPSLYEPWGVALAEAMASGLPVICSEACGASVELVRPYFNGLTVGTGDSAGLARAMLWLHQHVDHLPTMGERARSLATAFAADAWAERWGEMFRQLESIPRQHNRLDAPGAIAR